MKGNQFNIFIFMLPIGNQSSNVAKKKKKSEESINETQWKFTPHIDRM